MTETTRSRSGEPLKPLFSWRSAICESDLPSTSRLVALTLSLHMNERGGSCFPGVTTLANETGLSRQTVLTHLDTLEGRGWIVQANPGAGRGHRYGWEAVFPGVVKEVDQLAECPSDRSGQPDGQNRSTSSMELVNLTSPYKEEDVQRGRNENSASSFLRFWQAYPLKIAKGEARKAWPAAFKAVKGDGERIVTAAERYRDDPNRDPAFTRHPATWLRRECWDDDLLPPKPKLNGHKPEPAPHVSVPFAQRKAEEERARRERQRALERLGVEG